MIHTLLQRIAMWLVWKGPYLGRFGPVLFARGPALGVDLAEGKA